MLRSLAHLAAVAALIPSPQTTGTAPALEARRPRAAVQLGISRRAVLGGVLSATALTTFPSAVSAGFGSGTAAVTSSPQLRPLTPDELLALDPLKLSQRLGSISLSRAREILGQLRATVTSEDTLDALIAKLSEEAPSSALTEELRNLKAQLVQARKARELEEQVREQQVLLERLDSQPEWVVFGAAISASVISTSVMHPVDTFKTLKMGGSEDEGGAAEAGFSLSQLPSLYNGLSANLLKEGPPSALYLGVYEYAKSALQGRSALPELVIYLIAGALGELVGSVLRAPSEAAKTRVQSRLASSTGEAFLQLAAEPSQVLSQWGVSVLRDVPFGAIQLAIFESTKSFIVQSPDIEVNVNTLLAEAVLGGLGGFVGALVSAPADVLVTRMILQPEPEADGEAKLGALAMSKRILDEAGPVGFLNGAGARALYWTPAIAIFLASFCFLRKTALDIGLGI